MRPCLESSCPRLTKRTRCPEHERAYERARRPSPTLRGYDATYRRERQELIGLPCALRLPGCTRIATTADHVIPVSRGGRGGPLRPACRHCNSARGARSGDGEIWTAG